jgi:DNA-binding HxlR family transcriptional regulator
MRPSHPTRGHLSSFIELSIAQEREDGEGFHETQRVLVRRAGDTVGFTSAIDGSIPAVAMSTDPAPELEDIPLDECSLARALDVVADRWLLLILREALYGAHRFDAFQRGLGVSRSILSDRLDRLVDHGLLRRHPYTEPGQRVRHEYRLTRKGVDLIPVLIALMQWGDVHLRDDPPPIALYDAETGEPVRVEMVTASGRPLSSVRNLRSRAAASDDPAHG